MTTTAAFIAKWAASGAAERANAQLFVAELCALLGVDAPQPKTPDEQANAYVFEKTIPGAGGNKNFIDCYKRGFFVLEAKQGADAAGDDIPLSEAGEQRLARRKTGHGQRGTAAWDTAMERARKQAENYARRLPPEEIAGQGRPPFLLVADVGHSIALYADWSRAGGHYTPFPDPASYRIALDDLHRDEIRERLQLVWTDPLALDPSRRSARVTRQIADRLARLARSLEAPPRPSPQGEGVVVSSASPSELPENVARNAVSSTSPSPWGEGVVVSSASPSELPENVARNAVSSTSPSPWGEGRGGAERVAGFLMRSLFTMFAEDVGLLPERSFSRLLDEFPQDPVNFPHLLEALWRDMNTGGYSVALRARIPRFNGGLFAHPEVIELNADQVQLLSEAARADWRDVEPAIFGTLLERALDPRERHKLGAHYTPRAYVERLVQPAVIEPLRAEWEAVQAAALQRAEDGDTAKAIQEVETFLQKLAGLRILDPACGSGNFLYVTLEGLKRLEGEVLNTLRELGQGQQRLELAGVMVTPANFLGLEINPRAAAIAELVLWIGFLQWHLRTRGNLTGLAEPIIRDLHNVECRDAVLDWDVRQPLLDAAGQPVTRWDGRSTRTHPVTGEEVPDPDARVPVYAYTNPRPAEWPQTDYIVGNPPFIGTARMRDALGDGYTEALRKVYPNVPDSADFVMFWWDKAAERTRAGSARQFGFITTNSLRQTFNRRVLQHHLGQTPPIALTLAIPDHPWVDSGDGAAVRIAMTVGTAGEQTGRLQTVVQENQPGGDDAAEVTLVEKTGKVQSDLTVGADVAGAVALRANGELCSRGVQVIGAGFIISPEKARELGLGKVAGLEEHIRLYRNGRDLTATPREVMVIDLFGLKENEVRERFPEVYQHVYETVKPERDQNRRDSYRKNWWIHGEPRGNFRPALKSLPRYIATVETAKHRVFVFLDKEILPDNMLVNIALDDAYFFGVLSSKIHVTWALAAGGRLGYGNDPRYNKTRCFETFPFPAATDAQTLRIRELGERLDAHRKRQQAQYPELTLTDMYNVLEKERAGENLSDKERRTHEQGLVGILRQLHDELDAAVAEAYGWPAGLPEAEILERLVRLNAERAAEEAGGRIRWLRPEYQAPGAAAPGIQGKLLADEPDEDATAAAPAAKRLWPDNLPAQAAALRDLLATLPAPAAAAALAEVFEGKRTPKRVEQVQRLLETLAALGQAEEVQPGLWGR